MVINPALLCGIDVRNHLRQGVMAIEERLGAKDHIFRPFSAIFGMCIVDAFKFYYIAVHWEPE